MKERKQRRDMESDTYLKPLPQTLRSKVLNTGYPREDKEGSQTESKSKGMLAAVWKKRPVVKLRKPKVSTLRD